MKKVERVHKSPYHKRIWEEAEKRRQQIVTMRQADMTWVEISKTFGITPQRAQQLGSGRA